MALIQVKDFFLDKKLIEDVMKTLMGGTVSVAKCSNLTYSRQGCWRRRSNPDMWPDVFQGWQEKANQVDQQLTAVLRIMKELVRVGFGGSDLGAS